LRKEEMGQLHSSSEMGKTTRTLYSCHVFCLPESALYDSEMGKTTRTLYLLILMNCRRDTF
jgi:hypothetical protein